MTLNGYTLGVMDTRTRSPYHQSWGKAITRRRELIGKMTGEGMTQAELARRLGVTPVTVWRWEHGHGAPGPVQQAKLIDVLHFTGDELRDLISLADTAA